ncbi:MAG: hypothetical protein AAFO07_25840, partial [Bacteroidota bacterium]
MKQKFTPFFSLGVLALFTAYMAEVFVPKAAEVSAPMEMAAMMIPPTTLTAGDVAIISVQTDGTKGFNFVFLADIGAGTEVFFTDKGVDMNGDLDATNEGVVKYTAPSDLPAGTVIQFTGISGDFTEEETGFNLMGTGDQVIAFQGTVASPTYLFAIQTNSNQFQATLTPQGTSTLPPGLTEGTTALAVGAGSGDGDEVDNADYDEPLTTGTKAELLAAIGNDDNWTGSDQIITPKAVGPYIVCFGVPTLSGNDTGCENASNPSIRTFNVPLTATLNWVVDGDGPAGSGLSNGDEFVAPTTTSSIRTRFFSDRDNREARLNVSDGAPAGTYTFRAYYSSTDCTGELSEPFTVTILPQPDAPTITGEDEECEGMNAMLNVDVP